MRMFTLQSDVEMYDLGDTVSFSCTLKSTIQVTKIRHKKG